MEGVFQKVNSAALRAEKIWFSDGYIFVLLSDGRICGHPLSWYPRLEKASMEQLLNFELWSDGRWIHWEDLDEDLSAQGFSTYVGKP